MSTLDDLALRAHRARAAPTSCTSSGSSRRGGRSPTSRSPTSLLLAPIAGEEGHRFVVLAQVRPVTGQTNYPQDLVGTVVDEVERPLLARCWRSGEIVEADTHRARLEGARARAVHPGAARRPADRAASPARRR